MSNQRDPLQQSMVEDLHRVLFNSPHLKTMWHNAPVDDRRMVESAFLEWVWQMIFAAHTIKDTQGMTQENLQTIYKQFGGFILTCQNGKPARFMTSDWVAMDRQSFEAMVQSAQGKQVP